MAKDDTVENRVYLFESLARSYVSAASELLSSGDEAARSRVMRGLADLAFVSCVVADTGHLTPEEVRQRVLAPSEPEPSGSKDKENKESKDKESKDKESKGKRRA